MERNKKFFIVSFGNSREYIYEVENGTGGSGLSSSDSLQKVKENIKGYLEKQFPGESLAYFDTPQIREIKEEDLSEYAGYPKLDASAVKKIEAVLKKGVDVRQDNDLLDSDAPYSDVNIS